MQWWRSAMWVCAVGACWNWAGAAGGLLSLAAARAQRQLATSPPSRAQPEQLAKRQPPWADVPEALRALYAQLAARDSLPAAFLPRSPLQRRTANTVRGFTHQGSAIDRRFKDEDRFRLSFNVTVPDGESLKAAELVLARDRVNNLQDDTSSEQKHKVLVYDIVKPGRKGQTKPVLRLVDAKWVKLTQDGSVNLDVTTAVERWLWRPEENHGLLVHVQSPEHLRQHRHVRLKRAAGERRGAWSRRRPALLAYTDDGRAPLEPVVSPPLRPARSKRAARRTHRRKDGRETCQRRPLFVDFTDVGWSDWIVAPNGYDAFYCHGDCTFPLTDHLNSTNHAIVQTLVNSVNPTAVPKACCVPTALSSISMLYLDEENKVVLKNYQDMAVMGCGCR